MPTFSATEGELRHQVEHKLGSVPDRFWAFAGSCRWIGDVLDLEATADDRREAFEQLVARLRDLQQVDAERAPRSGSPVRLRASPPALAALARIAALEAGELPEVLAFQRAHGRVPARRIAAQLRLWAAADGAPRNAAERVRLDYPGGELPVDARRGGVIAELAGVCRRLCSLLGWGERDAVGFVLAGKAPPPFVASASLNCSMRSPLGDRVTLTVHPATTAREVARLYEQARGSARWPRSLSPKLAELAAFAAEVNDGRSWADALVAWSRRHPENRASGDWRTFRRDACRAFERVRGYPLRWLGRPGPPPRRRGPRRRK